jgi:PAS domain S-box-containing protein
MNQQLMELNNRLEEQVVERTTVLSATNVRLEQEIVERRRIETELRERVCLATLTADVSVDLAQGHDLQNTLQRCLEAIMHHLDVASVQIWTLNHEENILELQASAGIESQCDKLSRRSPLNHSTIGCIVKEGTPHLTNEALNDPYIQEQEWIRQEGLVAFAGYPLIVDDQVVGGLALFSRQRLSEATLQTLAALANDIAIGIERKRAEEALQQSERHFRSLIEHTSDVITILNADGVIRYQSPSSKRLLGYEPEEFVGRSVFDFAHPDDAATARQFFTQAVQTRKAGRPQQLRLRHKDGSWRIFEAISSPLLEHEEGIGFIVNSRDITERKQLEAQLALAQKMESIGQLAAGIAHEINTPAQYVSDNICFLRDAFHDLEQLLGHYVRLLDANKAGAIPSALLAEIEATTAAVDLTYLVAEIPQAIQQSQQGIERVTKIVRAMKEFSHPGAEEKSETDLNHAIETTITVARNEWKYVADVVTDFDPTLPLVRCLSGEFNQVILNLIVNAAHAIADVVGNSGASKGTITVRTRHDENWAEIRISDTGTGIPEAIRMKIFDPFFTTKGVGKGTGQGLAIAHSVIVDKHGGTITCETEVGKGTTFIIRLPLRPPDSQMEALL